jgi:hypothetical protein
MPQSPLAPAQRSVLNTALSEARRYNAGPKVTKALVEAGIVESNLRNLNYGDRDSLGFLQQRPSQGWGTPQQVTNPRYAADKFLQAAIPLAGKYGTAGELAQAVQRSAFPGRYQQQSGLADALIGRPGHSGPAAAPYAQPTAQAPEADALRRLAIFNYLEDNTPNDLTNLVSALGQIPQDTVSSGTTGTTKTAAPTAAGGGHGLPKGVVQFDGKPVAAWIARDLQWAKQHGWTGTVTSGYRTFQEQKRIYDSGVRPAAVPGTSNHEMTAFPGGAVDVTNAAQLAQILSKKPGGSLLVWAGGKDPVHFSHPHGGGY